MYSESHEKSKMPRHEPGEGPILIFRVSLPSRQPWSHITFMSRLNLAASDLPFEIAIPVADISGVAPLRPAVLGPALSLSGDETT